MVLLLPGCVVRQAAGGGLDGTHALDGTARGTAASEPPLAAALLVQVAPLVKGPRAAVCLPDNLIVLEGGYRFFVRLREKGKMQRLSLGKIYLAAGREDEVVRGACSLSVGEVLLTEERRKEGRMDLDA